MKSVSFVLGCAVLSGGLLTVRALDPTTIDGIAVYSVIGLALLSLAACAIGLLSNRPRPVRRRPRA